MTSAAKDTSENYVKLRYELRLGDGTPLAGVQDCWSGQPLAEVEWYRAAQLKVDENGRHRYDPDAQVCEWLANQVWNHYNCNDAEFVKGARSTTGNIILIDAQGPCSSCRNVITALRNDFPQVHITVNYPKGLTKTTGGPGLGDDVYGYDDAEEDGQYWKKIIT